MARIVNFNKRIRNLNEFNDNLVIGLGGTGGRVLKELRKRLFDEYEGIPGVIGFMYIDSSDELTRQDDPSWLTPEGYNAQFTNSEFLDISLPCDGSCLLGHYEAYPYMKGLIDSCKSLKFYRPHCGAMQNRRLGRVLLRARASSFDGMLHLHVAQLQEITGYNSVNFTIVTGLSGGTGSGCVVSVIGHIWRLYPDARITVMATLPPCPPPPGCDTGYYLANSYAALRELNALNIGRLELTDLMTGEKFQPGMPYDPYLSYCHKRQENKVFRLFVFERFYNEYDKISNILYHNLRIQPGYTAEEDYLRATLMYSTITEPECDASVREGEVVYARTKAVGLLGLYRFVYPRQQILRYVAYGVAEQSYNQLLFNNYIESLGYICEPLPTPPLDIKELRQWGMDEDHLTLNVPYDDRYQHFHSFRDEWDNVSSLITGEAAATSEKSKMRDMAERFRSYYDCHFRHEGAERYFQAATACIKYHANLCIGRYESYITEKLMAGEKSVCNVIDETRLLIDHFRQLRQEAERNESSWSDEIRNLQCEADKIIQRFESAPLLRIFRGQRDILQLKHVLTDLYVGKTRQCALAYERQLLQVLEARVQETAVAFGEFRYVLTDKREEARHLAQKETEAPSYTFYVVNPLRVIEFERKLFCNRLVMENLTALTRKRIFEEEQQPIRRLVSDIRHELKPQHLISLYYDTILQADMEHCDPERLFSTGILQEIQSMPIDSSRLDDMLRTAMSAADVSPLLNDNEMLKAVRNNPFTADVAGFGRACTLVCVHQPTTGREKELIDEFTTAVRALGNHDRQMVEINNHSDNCDEISIATVCSGFPLRCLKSLPKLKNQYDELLSHNGQQAVAVLHTEDSFTELPSLEVETKAEATCTEQQEMPLSSADPDLPSMPSPPRPV